MRRGLFAGDIDADGDLDVIATSEVAAEVSWYENTDGLGSFGAAQIIVAAAPTARGVSVADADGDGDLDVFTGSSATVMPSLARMRGDSLTERDDSSGARRLCRSVGLRRVEHQDGDGRVVDPGGLARGEAVE